MSHPIAAGPLAPAAAEQSSAWIVDQSAPAAHLRHGVRNPGHSRQAGLQRLMEQLELAWAGGVRRPGTCAGRGQGYPEPETAAAKEEIQYSDLCHVHLV